MELWKMACLRCCLLCGIIVSFSIAGFGCDAKPKSSETTVEEQLALAKKRAAEQAAKNRAEEIQKAKEQGRVPPRQKAKKEDVRSRAEIEAEYEKQRQDKIDSRAEAKRNQEYWTRLREATPRQKIDIYAEDRPEKEVYRRDRNAAIKFTKDKTYRNNLATNIDRRAFYGLGVQHFSENSRLPAQTKQSVTELSEKVLKSNYPGKHEPPADWESMHQQADQLIAGDCGDEPMVLLIGSIAATNAGEHADAFEWINRSIKAFHKSVYPDRMYAFARVWSMIIMPNHGLEINHQENINVSSSTFFNWLAKDFRAEPDEYRFVFELLNEFFFYIADHGSPRGFQKMIIDEGIAPPWLNEVIKMKYYSSQAWAARGNGFAHTVTERGWEIFRKSNEQSVKAALKAYEINPAFPQAAAELATLAYLGSGDKSAEYWMAKVQEAQFDYPPIFRTYLNYAQPKWGGDNAEQLDFGMECYETGRFDTDVPFVLIEAVFAIFKTGTDDDMKLLSNNRIYAAIRDCLTQYAKQRPESQRGYYLSYRAVLATRFRQLEDAIDDLIELDDKVHHDALSLTKQGRSSEYWSGQILAHEEEHREVTLELMALLGDKNWTREFRKENAEKIKSLVDKGQESNIDPLEKQCFEHYRRTIDFENLYYAGEWVDWDFVQGLYEWNGGGLHCMTVKDGVLTMDSTKISKRPSMSIMPTLKLPGPKTLEAVIEVFNPTDYGQFDAGFTFSPPGNSRRPGRVYLSTTRQTLGVLTPTDWALIKLENKEHGKRKLRVNVTDGYLEVFVDDQFVTAMNSASIDPGDILRIGQINGIAFRGKATFENFRIRKWDIEGCPMAQDQKDGYDKEEVIDWLGRAQQLYPEQPYYTWRIALAHFNAGEYEDAAIFAKKSREMGMPSSRTGLMEGFAMEVAGDYDKAVEFYSMQDDKDEVLKLYYESPRANISYALTPESVATAWKAWLLVTAGDVDVDPEELELSPEYQRMGNWAFDRILASITAWEGNYNSAAARMRSILRNEKHVIPDDIRAEMQEQEAAYEADKWWKRDMDSKPFYHSLDLHIVPSYLYRNNRGLIRH